MSDPIPGSAAVLGDGDDADYIDLKPVDQRIGKAVERQHPRVARAGFAQLREPLQEVKRLIHRIGEIVRCDKRAFADVPIDNCIGVS